MGEIEKVGQCHAIANLFVLLLPIIVGLPVIFAVVLVKHAPTFWSFVTFGSYGFGLLLFLLAKLSVIRAGMLISFGSAQMSSGYRWCYRVGFVLMGLGLFLTFGYWYHRIPPEDQRFFLIIPWCFAGIIIGADVSGCLGHQAFQWNYSQR